MGLQSRTVLVGRNQMMRVGRELLGRLAGNRDLRFRITYDRKNRMLVLRPTLKLPGWPSVYWSEANKSPWVSLRPAMRMYELSDKDLPAGTYPVEVRRSAIRVDLSSTKK